MGWTGRLRMSRKHNVENSRDSSPARDPAPGTPLTEDEYRRLFDALPVDVAVIETDGLGFRPIFMNRRMAENWKACPPWTITDGAGKADGAASDLAGLWRDRMAEAERTGSAV